MVDGREEFEVAKVLTHKPQGKKKTDPKVKFLLRSEGYKDDIVHGSHTRTWKTLLMRSRSTGT